MIPSTSVLASFHKASGGGGGGTYWNDIFGAAIADPSGTTPVNGDNSPGFTVGLSGSLNFTYTAGIGYSIRKNGVSLGAVASTNVVPGDIIYMTAAASVNNVAGSKTGTITVSGLYSDTINVELDVS